MSLNELNKQIRDLKQRISQLDQWGREEEGTRRRDELQSLEFEQSQLELEKLLKEKEKKPKRTRRRRTKKMVEEDTPTDLEQGEKYMEKKRQ